MASLLVLTAVITQTHTTGNGENHKSSAAPFATRPISELGLRGRWQTCACSMGGWNLSITHWVTGAGMGGTGCVKGGKSDYLQDGNVKKLHIRVKTCTHIHKQTQTETTHHPTSWLMLGGVISELWKDRWIQPARPPVATKEKLKQLTSVKSCYAESPPCSAFGFCSRRNTQRAIVTEQAQVSMATLKQ